MNPLVFLFDITTPAIIALLTGLADILRGEMPQHSFLTSWIIIAAGVTIFDLIIPGFSVSTVPHAISWAIALALWFWKRRRDVRRVMRELGGKALARLAAITKRARRAGKGLRPRLREPVPA